MRDKVIQLIASGDLRLSANKAIPEQAQMEKELELVAKSFGYILKRVHEYDKNEGHGFIASQRQGMDTFLTVNRDAPIIVAEAVWQYSHHILSGLISHRGPILTLANWSGKWPGLVGMLNLNGSLTKAGVEYSTLWSEDFSNDSSFKTKFQDWLNYGKVDHDTSHVKPYNSKDLDKKSDDIISTIINELDTKKAIMGVFDEFCMGMYNAAIPDELMFPLGVFKEHISQSALFSEMQKVSDEDAEKIFKWITERGFQFHFGIEEEKDLTKNQVLEQCRMYIAACRIGDYFGCDAIGIQYQQGLKDLCPA